MYSKELFGQRLLQARKRAHDTQSDLGQLLDVGKSHVSEMEHGISSTSLDGLARICLHYGVSADYLLGLSDDPTLKNQVQKEWESHAP